MEDIAGKCAVVVGAATGIGAGIARTLAARGAAVELADIDMDGAEALAEALRADGASAHAARVDVTDAPALGALEAAVRARTGRIDLLFANAGAICLKPFLDTTAHDWRWLFDVNLFGCVNTIHAFLPGMLAQEGTSRILVTSSINTLRTPPMAGQTVYMATKAAQVGLCKGLENDLAGTNVAVSLIYPGSVATRIKEKSAQLRSDAIGMTVPDGVHRGSPLTPEQAGAMIVDQLAQGRRHIMTHPGERDRIVAAQAAILESLDAL
jgi:NAD(P)-dependent dehydrogenase (short-subunit alcohol dehydrogenase family)